MKEKFEIKPPGDTSPTEFLDRLKHGQETTPRKDRGVATSNGVETQEEISAEALETVVEEEKVKNAWQELVAQAKEEFPEEIKLIIDKTARKEQLIPQEIGALDSFSYHWFKYIFGITKKKPPSLEKKFLSEEKPAEQQKLTKKSDRKKIKAENNLSVLKNLATQKINNMERLHIALRNLDAGESVEEFIDETRRAVYFDEENQQYFVEEKGERKNLGIGDISSDYAWGIKYFPDSRMADTTAYRTLAKRILVNETRRDIEKIHNLELIILGPHRDSANSFVKIWPRVKAAFEKTDTGVAKQQLTEKLLGDVEGWIIEVAVREFVSRLSLNAKLDFVVSRATVEEDADYKYDFKVRVKHRLRGVDVQSKNISSVGFQLKSELKRMRVSLGSPQTKKGITKVVDEVLTLRVPGREFGKAIKKWFEVGEPSGGPEQFLSPELKRAILKAVTEKLVDIPQDVFDKIE